VLLLSGKGGDERPNALTGAAGRESPHATGAPVMTLTTRATATPM